MFYVRLSALFALFLTLYTILTGGMKDFTENIEETDIKKSIWNKIILHNIFGIF